MKWILYYHDGYHENGDVGVEEFDSESQAIDAIEERLLTHREATLENYILIKGERVTLEAVSQISRVRVKP